MTTDDTGDGTGGATDPPVVPARRYVLRAVAVVLIVATGTVWLARKPVAEHFIDDALRARGVPARYHIERIGLRTQRLTQVRIGDPSHPDLVADWIEIDTSLWTSGPTITAFRVGKIRLRARATHGGVTFGAIDRLLPAPTGKPFALPGIYAEIGDARIALATPQGDVALTVTGAGRLDSGFAGTIRATAGMLDTGACTVQRATATLRISVASSRPRFAGPIAFARGACGESVASDARAEVSLSLTPKLDHFDGSARLAVAALATKDAKLSAVSGPVTVTGSATDLAGTVDLRSGPFTAGGINGAATALTGRYRYAAGGLAFDGRATGIRAALPARMLAHLDPLRSAAPGTPVGPILAQIARAAAAAGRSADITADVSAILDAGRGQVVVSRADIMTASGARARFSGGSGLGYHWPDAGLRIDTDAVIGGGGLPGVRLHLAQAAPGGTVTGHAIVAPYAAGDARLALAPIDFTAGAGGATRLTTRAILSGPLANGRVERLSLPIVASWDGATRLTVDPA